MPRATSRRRPPGTGHASAGGPQQAPDRLECRILRVPGGHVVCVLPVESDPDLFDAPAIAGSDAVRPVRDTVRMDQ
jgi:hypothetical protein